MGSAPIDKVKETLSLQFEHEECETFGGYIFGLLGTIPDDGTTFDVETEVICIHVDSVEEHRILFTTVTKKQAEEHI